MMASDDSIGKVRDFCNALFRRQPVRITTSVLLATVLPFCSGLSLLLLVPILQGAEGEAPGSVASARARVFEILDLKQSVSNGLLLFIAVSIAYSLLTLWHARTNARLKMGFSLSCRTDLYRAICQADWHFFLLANRHDIGHALTQEIARVGKTVQALLALTSTTALIAIYMVISMWLSPHLTAVVMLGGAGLVPVILVCVRKAHHCGRDLSMRSQEFYRRTLEHLSGIKESKTLGAERRHLAQFTLLAQNVAETETEFEDARGVTFFVFSSAAATAVAVVISVAVEFLAIPPDRLLALFLIYAKMTPRVLHAQKLYQELVHSLPAYAAIQGIQRSCEAHSTPVTASTSSRKFSAAPTINLEHLGFRYSQSQDAEWAIRNITEEIPKRAITAIVGTSGSGKTTLADTLLSLLKPIEGDVLVDGISIHDHQQEWRRIIACVPQETFLLHDTIRANLLWGAPDATESEIWEALRLASVDNVVLALPEMLGTVVGDRGSRLSGGQRQRIALARALLRNPSVLILDEATSALDDENTQKINASLQSLAETMTIIVIAHTKEAIRNADHVIVLDSGEVIESGPLDELEYFERILAA